MNRHLLLTNGRSGSNAFVQMLNQHPNVTNYGEVLGPWTHGGKHVRPLFRGEGGTARYLDWLYRSGLAFRLAQVVSLHSHRRRKVEPNYKVRPKITSLGIKDFALNFERMGLHDYLDIRPDIRLVALSRDDVLARYISTRSLSATKQVARTVREAGPSTIGPILRLDPNTIVSALDSIERENELVRAAARTHRGPVFRLSYEEFFGSTAAARQRTMCDLQRFLGVEPRDLPLEHVKLRQQPIADSIANFPEVCERLNGTPHARWLGTS